MFGITCGSDLIRRLANDWSWSRKVTEEADQKAFWRVTFNNLNLKCKFAKTFGDKNEGSMLNLMMGQVTHSAGINKDSQVVAKGDNETCSLISDEFCFLKQIWKREKRIRKFLRCLGFKRI